MATIAAQAVVMEALASLVSQGRLGTAPRGKGCSRRQDRCAFFAIGKCRFGDDCRFSHTSRVDLGQVCGCGSDGGGGVIDEIDGIDATREFCGSETSFGTCSNEVGCDGTCPEVSSPVPPDPGVDDAMTGGACSRCCGSSLGAAPSFCRPGGTQSVGGTSGVAGVALQAPAAAHGGSSNRFAALSGDSDSDDDDGTVDGESDSVCTSRCSSDDVGLLSAFSRWCEPAVAVTPRATRSVFVARKRPGARRPRPTHSTDGYSDLADEVAIAVVADRIWEVFGDGSCSDRVPRAARGTDCVSFSWVPKAQLFASDGGSSSLGAACSAVKKNSARSQDVLGQRDSGLGSFRGDKKLSAAGDVFCQLFTACDTGIGGPSADKVTYLIHRAARCSDPKLALEMYAGTADMVIDGRAFSRAEIAAARSAIVDLFNFAFARGSPGSVRTGSNVAAEVPRTGLGSGMSFPFVAEVPRTGLVLRA